MLTSLEVSVARIGEKLSCSLISLALPIQPCNDSRSPIRIYLAVTKVSVSPSGGDLERVIV